MKDINAINVVGETVSPEIEGLQVQDSDTSETKYKVKVPTKSRYHGYPTAWDKSMAAYNRLMEESEKSGQITFHRKALNEVRKALGKNCRHLVHSTDSSKIISFKAYMVIDGKTKIVNVDSEKTAENLDAESYRNLNEVLRDVIGSKKTV